MRRMADCLCRENKWRAGDEETENYTYAIALQNDT